MKIIEKIKVYNNMYILKEYLEIFGYYTIN